MNTMETILASLPSLRTDDTSSVDLTTNDDSELDGNETNHSLRDTNDDDSERLLPQNESGAIKNGKAVPKYMNEDDLKREAKIDRLYRQQRQVRQYRQQELLREYDTLKQELKRFEEKAAEDLREVQDRHQVALDESWALQAELASLLRTERKRRKSLQLRNKQESILSEKGEMIRQLKKENQRLRRGSIKMEQKLEEVTETSERLTESTGVYFATADRREPVMAQEEHRFQVLSKQLKMAKDRNESLMNKLDKEQARYMSVAQQRASYQNWMNRIYKLVLGTQTAESPSARGIVAIAEATDTEVRRIMESLELDTMEPDTLDFLAEIEEDD